MATYTQCGEEMTKRVKNVMVLYHPELREAGVTLNLLFAMGKEGKPGVTHAGYPALAKVKIVSLKDRVAGLNDATIIFDEREWAEMSEERRTAIIDHELYHLSPVRLGAKGPFKEDDCGRPVLKIAKHDFHGGGFLEIVKRHQMNAVEASFVESVHVKFQQGLLFESLKS